MQPEKQNKKGGLLKSIGKATLPVIFTTLLAGSALAKDAKIVRVDTLKREAPYSSYVTNNDHGIYLVDEAGKSWYCPNGDINRAMEIKDPSLDMFGYDIAQSMVDGTLDPRLIEQFATKKKSKLTEMDGRFDIGLRFLPLGSQKIEDEKGQVIVPGTTADKTARQSGMTSEFSIDFDTKPLFGIFRAVYPGLLGEGFFRYQSQGRASGSAKIGNTTYDFALNNADIMSYGGGLGLRLFINLPFSIGDLRYAPAISGKYSREMANLSHVWISGNPGTTDLEKLVTGVELKGFRTRDGNMHFYWTESIRGQDNVLVNEEVQKDLTQDRKVREYKAGMMFPAIMLFKKSLGADRAWEIQFGVDYIHNTTTIGKASPVVNQYVKMILDQKIPGTYGLRLGYEPTINLSDGNVVEHNIVLKNEF